MTKLRCQPGDLAIVTGGNPNRIGMLVMVVGPDLDYGWDWNLTLIGQPVFARGLAR